MVRSISYFNNLTSDELVREAFDMGLCDSGMSHQVTLAHALWEIEVLRDRLRAIEEKPKRPFLVLPPGFTLGTQ